MVCFFFFFFFSSDGEEIGFSKQSQTDFTDIILQEVVSAMGKFHALFHRFSSCRSGMFSFTCSLWGCKMALQRLSWQHAHFHAPCCLFLCAFHCGSLPSILYCWRSFSHLHAIEDVKIIHIVSYRVVTLF